MIAIGKPNASIGDVNARHSSPLRVGIGGPVGSGKTALVEALCKRLRNTCDIYVITNDIYTKEDQLILTRAEALPAGWIALSVGATLALAALLVAVAGGLYRREALLG